MPPGPEDARLPLRTNAFPPLRRHSSVAEQRFCKPLAGGSNPSAGTKGAPNPPSTDTLAPPDLRAVRRQNRCVQPSLTGLAPSPSRSPVSPFPVESALPSASPASWEGPGCLPGRIVMRARGRPPASVRPRGKGVFPTSRSGPKLYFSRPSACRNDRISVASRQPAESASA